MKNTTLAAAALIGGLVGFSAPNAEAFPQGNQQIDVEQTATVTEVGFWKYKKRYRKHQQRRRYRDDHRRAHRSDYRRDRHRGHSYQDDHRQDYGRKHYRGKVSKGGFTVYF